MTQFLDWPCHNPPIRPIRPSHDEIYGGDPPISSKILRDEVGQRRKEVTQIGTQQTQRR